MLQCVQSWAKSLGKNEHEIIRRLNKENVRAQKNVRLGGEGGTPHAHGTAAHAYGVQASQNLQGYINGIPAVSQAQNFLGHFAPPSGAPPGFPSRDAPPSSTVSMPDKFDAPYAPPMGPPSSSYGPPTSPPPSFPGAPERQDSYVPPSGPPPSWPGTGGYSDPAPHVGYTPAYTSPPPTQTSFPPQPPFPGGGPGGFGGPPGGGGFGFPSPGGPGGFAPPPGGPPPGFPGPFGAPGGAPPPFPPYGNPSHQHSQSQGGGSSYPGAQYRGGW
jgi:hypothetical protein